MSQESKDDLIVYGAPGCVQCRYTTKLLEKEQIPFKYVDVSQDDEAARRIGGGQGKLQLPVVEARGDRWNGFSPDKLRSLKR